MPAKDIAELSGYAPLTIYRILADERVNVIRQQMLEGVQQEFEALYSQVVDILRKKLNSMDETIQMQAVNSFFREKERLQGKKGGEGLTAEDIVKHILQVNIQVNT
jgi:hypothetical protein